MNPAPWKTWTSQLRSGTLDWDTPWEPSGRSVLDVVFAAWFEQPKQAVDAWKFAQRLAHLSKTAWSWVPDLPAHQQPSVRLFLVLSGMGVDQTASSANRWSKGLFPSSLSASERKDRWGNVFEAMDHFQSVAMCQAWLRLTMAWWWACLVHKESMSPDRLNHRLGLEKAWGDHQGVVLGALLERVPGWLERISEEKGPLAARETWETSGGTGNAFRVDGLGQALFDHPEVVAALKGWVSGSSAASPVWKTSLAMDASLALWCRLASPPPPSCDAFMHMVLEREKAKAAEMLRQLNAVLKGSEMSGEQWEAIVDQQAVMVLNRRFPLAVERWRAHRLGQTLDQELPSADPVHRPRM